MHRKERIDDLREMLQTTLQGWQGDVWSAMPGIIQSVDFSQQTCVVQIAIQMLVTDAVTGTKNWTSVSPLLDCPLYFPHGGNCSITFPVAEGDECLVVFASRCIDGWWQNGEVSPQAIYRMHDLSDGFAFAGFRSVPKVVSSISSTKLEIRSADGENKISLDPTGGTIEIDATNEIKLNAPVVTITAPIIDAEGTLSVSGDAHMAAAATVGASLAVATTLSVAGRDFATHVHSGVRSGSSDTGPVV